MMKMTRRFTHSTKWNVLLGVLLVLQAIVLFVLFSSPVLAQAALTVTPLTWDVIGLDSNKPPTGPQYFPVGARVCNTGNLPANNMTASLQWDGTRNAYIDYRSGTNSSITIASLAAGACYDFYFEIQVQQVPAAYDTVQGYHIQVTANSGATTSSTPIGRQLYIEHLISQSRNSVLDMQLSTNGTSFTSIPAGGTMDLMVGSTYYIKLVGATATNGYEQIESFINFPNTIFQIQSVTTTWTAHSLPTPYDKLYGDGCTWVNNPNDPNYRSCLGTGKNGGNVTVIYKVTILSVPGAPLINPEPLTTLIYDFSGSSFHYNADFSTSVRFANIISPSSVTLNKTFTPSSITPNSTSVMTITLNNPTNMTFTGVNFTDTFPSGVVVSTTPGIAYNGCGSGAFSPTPVSGSTSVNFTNGTLNANSTCTVQLNVTSASTGTYTNTTGHLFINNTTDTGNFYTDTLKVSSITSVIPPASCAVSTTLAYWTMPTASSAPPTADYRASNVSFATASAGLTGTGTQGVIDVTNIGNPRGLTYGWSITDTWSTGTTAPGANSTPYFGFSIDSSNYGGVSIRFDADQETPGDWANPIQNIYLYSRADTGSWTVLPTGHSEKGKWGTVYYTTTADLVMKAAQTGTSSTSFEIHITSAQKSPAQAIIDNIYIYGCARPQPPTITKSFSPTPIAQNGTSTLTFNIANPNTNYSLSGISVNDVLPPGLTVANATTSACGGTNNLVTTAPRTIALTGGSLAANGTCSFNVTVTGATAGHYNNVSNAITATESGPNTTSTGVATASLDVVAPPIIAKQYSVSPIFVGNTTVLTYTITNPNPSTTLNGIAFTDVLTTTAGILSLSSTTSTCGGTASTSGQTVTLTGGSLAGGGTCTVVVTVTGNAVGTSNSSTTVSSTNGGTGNTAQATVDVRQQTPNIGILKQISTSPTGPWFTSLTFRNPLPTSVYYRFTVENTGYRPLTSINVTDNRYSAASCNAIFANPLPIADISDNQLTYCVIGPQSVTSGVVFTNTATAHGTYNSTVYNSLNSIARYDTSDPTSVTLSQFKAHTSDMDDLSLLVFGIAGGMTLLGGTLWVITHKRKIAK